MTHKLDSRFNDSSTLRMPPLVLCFTMLILQLEKILSFEKWRDDSLLKLRDVAPNLLKTWPSPQELNYRDSNLQS